MHSLDDLKHLFAAKAKCIWIKTYEEAAVIDYIKKYLIDNSLAYDLASWSMTSGLQSEPLLNNIEKNQPDKQFANIEKMLNFIDRKQTDENEKTCLYIFKDLHLLLENKMVIRALRDMREKPSKEIKSYQPIIVVSPVIEIPVEHEKLFTVLEFETPSREEITKIINAFVAKMEKVAEKKGYVVPSERDIKECINFSIGLTKNELMLLLAKSLSKYKTISTKVFYEARVELINKTGLLELIDANISMDDMGGNHNFKNWVEDVQISILPEAEEYGVEKSKGYVAIGIPGTSKTLSAEMIATTLNMPLIKFNISKVMSSLVGKSEKNMESALNIVKACSPCVLLVDEVEKSLSGMQSSGRTDGGTMARVIGSMLQFLSSDKSKDIFTVMTSNDISQMPPELTRSGRLDTVWYFGLPTEEERKEIWRIHFDKSPIEVTDDILSYASSHSANLTGAEIKEAVKVSIRNSYKRFVKTGEKVISTEDILNAINDIVPVYNASKEKIMMLEKYAETRAKFASRINKKTSSITKRPPTIKISDLANKK